MGNAMVSRKEYQQDKEERRSTTFPGLALAIQKSWRGLQNLDTELKAVSFEYKIVRKEN